MAMTKREFLAKNEIRLLLAKKGYVTYSNLLKDFEIHLTKDPEVIGYMIPDRGVITVNEGLDIDQVGVIVRHEILHEFFNHAKRLADHLGATNGSGVSRSAHKVGNIAGDYDISNRGYTEQDKEDVRHIRINGETISGLVTEDDHPDWVGLSFTEMYDELQKLREQEKKKFQDEVKQRYADHDQNYIDTYNKIISKYENASLEELNDLMKRFQNGESIL